MQYKQTVRGKFIDRPNRFIAHVEVQGKTETVHVKNTGRCAELLVPGAEVALAVSDNPARKTGYDLTAVQKAALGWVNIDSQAPNRAVLEWLKMQGYDTIRPEYPYGKSRIDFYLEKNGERFLVEIKGCTLELDGIGFFPDAPTARGARHLRELAGAVREGWRAAVGFVIQMENICEVRPNTATDPDFAKAWQEAAEAGVEIWFFHCRVSDDSMEIIDRKKMRT